MRVFYTRLNTSMYTYDRHFVIFATSPRFSKTLLSTSEGYRDVAELFKGVLGVFQRFKDGFRSVPAFQWIPEKNP